MSSYSAYSSHHKAKANRSQYPDATSPSGTNSPSVSSQSDLSQIHIDYSSPRTDAQPMVASPSSTLRSKLPNDGSSSSMALSTTPLNSLPKWRAFRLNVMRMATVERLQMLWALLALFGTMSWLALAPSLTFRNKNDAEHFKSSVYNFFLFATVCTSLSAIWQSLCPFLIRQSQQALFPRVINHPATQTATIVISIVLTLLNFFSWMVLASDKEAGAKTSCTDGTYRLSDKPGYVAQCRGVNVAIVFDVVVFLLWLPISLVIVCGTVERGLWWWGDDDGWAQGELVGGSNMMSEEEFDLKIGMGSGKQIKRRQTVHPDNLEQQQEREMVQRPKPAFVTPIASQFRSQSADDEDDDINFTPSSYRRHRQQRQQRQTQVQVQEPKRLTRRGSNTSLSSRLSSFFGQGWASGMMPPEDEPPMPQLPSQYRNNNNLSVPTTPTGATPGGGNKKKVQMAPPPPSHRKEEREAEPEPAGLMHGDSYSSQWHSRWS